MAKAYSLGAAMYGNVSDTPAGFSGKAAKADTRKAAGLRRVEIEVADNGGFVVTCYHKPTAEKTKGDPYGYQEPVKSVYEDWASASAYIAKKVGGSDAA